MMDPLGLSFTAIALISAAFLGVVTTPLGQDWWAARPARRAVICYIFAFLALGFGLAREFRSTQLAVAAERKSDEAAKRAADEMAILRGHATDAAAKVESLQAALTVANRHINLLSHHGSFQVFPPLDGKFIDSSTGTFAPAKVMCAGTDKTVPPDAFVLLEDAGDGTHALRIPFHHHPSNSSDTNWWAMMLSIDPDGSWLGQDLGAFSRLMIEAKFEKAFPGEAVAAAGDGRVELKVRMQDAHGGTDKKGQGGTGWCKRSMNLTDEYLLFVFDFDTGFGAPFSGEKPLDLGNVMQIVVGQDGDTPAAHGTVLIRRAAFVP